MTTNTRVFKLIFLVIILSSIDAYSQQNADRWSVGLSPIYGVTSGTIKNDAFPFGFAQNSWGLDLKTQFQFKDSWGLGLAFSYQYMGYDANRVAEYLLNSDSKAIMVDVKTRGYNIYSLSPFLFYKWKSTSGFFIKVHTGAGMAMIQSPQMEAFVYSEPHTEFMLSRGITNTIVYHLGIQPGFQVNNKLNVLFSLQGTMSSPEFRWQDAHGMEHSQNLSFRQIILGLGIEYQLCIQKNNGKF